MPSNYNADDPVLGRIDLDDKFVTDAWLIDQFVGNKLFVWGSGIVGQLGLNDTTARSSPTILGTLSNWKQTAASDGSFSTAVKIDGTLWTWGNAGSGGLGQNNPTTYSSPVQVGLLTNWKQVIVGELHTLSIKNDGTLWAWGRNLSGELGDNTIVSKSSPTQIGTLTNWKIVSSGFYHSASIKNDGTLWMWGNNQPWGQLGLNDLVHRSSPVQVGALTNWKQITGGSSYATWAIKTDGTLWSWGRNDYGQLGLNDIVHRSSPVQVGSLTNWKQVSAGTNQVLAVKTDGTLWAWGHNTSGQLGVNDIVHRSSPTQVGSLTTWKRAINGGFHSMAIKNDGTLWAWGLNNNGQLGQGDIVHRSSPIQIGSLTNWKFVSCGRYQALAINYADIT